VQDLAETVLGRAAEWSITSADDVRAAPGPLAGLGEEMTALNAELRQFLLLNVYRHYRVYRMWIKAKRVIGELFHSLKAEPAQLPLVLHRTTMPTVTTGNGPGDTSMNATPPASANVPRLVCDYLAGLSDRE